MRIGECESVSINGIDCWSTRQFAELTGRSKEYVRALISRGNKFRKLRSVRIDDKRVYIPVEELFKYPFLNEGRPSTFGVLINYFVLSEDDPNKLEVIERAVNEGEVIEEDYTG